MTAFCLNPYIGQLRFIRYWELYHRMYGTWGDVTVLAEEAFKWGFSLRRLQNPSGNLHLKTSSASSATSTCNWNILKFNIEHPTFIRKLFSFTSKAQPSHISCDIPPNSG